MAEPTENIFDYPLGGGDQGCPAVRDDMSISMGPRSLSDTSQPETTHPEIGTLGEALITAMNKETTK